MKVERKLPRHECMVIDHVGRLALQRLVGHRRVDRRQRIRIVAALARMLALAADRTSSTRRCRPSADSGSRRRRTRGSPSGRPWRGRRRRRRGPDRPVLLIDLPALAEVQRARRRNGHLRRDLGVRLQKLEVIEMRMAGEAELADDAHALGLGLDAGELDALAGVEHLDAIETLVEIELPPGAAELAVGRELEADLLLLPDDLLDLAILDRLELRRRRSRPWRASRAPPSAARCAAGCRRDRRGTAAWCVAWRLLHSRLGSCERHARA